MSIVFPTFVFCHALRTMSLWVQITTHHSTENWQKSLKLDVMATSWLQSLNPLALSLFIASILRSASNRYSALSLSSSVTFCYFAGKCSRTRNIIVRDSRERKRERDDWSDRRAQGRIISGTLCSALPVTLWTVARGLLMTRWNSSPPN